MDISFLVSVMGTLTVVATYYWVGRPEPASVLPQLWQAGPLPRLQPPFWSNEWIP
jgi:hypothetical protein